MEIKTENLKHNVQQIRKLLPADFKIAGVVKGNAYGHGLLEIAHYLDNNKLVEYLATANDQEALFLRKNRISLPIIVLSYWDIKNLTALVKNNIEFGVYNNQQLEALQKAKLTKPAKAHLKIDTGMNRLGLSQQQAIVFASKLKAIKNLKINGIFSHLAVADEDKDLTKKQLAIFSQTVRALQKITPIPLIHIANSAGCMFMENNPCNLARVGLAIYGLSPSLNYPAKLKPILSWKTRIIQIKKVSSGEKTSYGLTYRFTKPATIAVLPIGYADGFDRGLSNCGRVLIGGQPCPIRGRVCMNLTMVELSANVKAGVGDEAVLIGQQGQKNNISADTLAQKLGTINYEIITRINPEIPRLII